MTSYELMEYYESILEKMESLAIYNDELYELISTVDNSINLMLNTIYTKPIDSSITGIINQRKNEVINIMQKFAMEFDTLDNHGKLIRLKDEIGTILDNAPECLEDEKNKINHLLCEYTDAISVIYKFVRSRDISTIVDLLNKTRLIVAEYSAFIKRYENIKNFMEKTENTLEVADEEEVFKLHFYSEHSAVEDYIENFKSLNDSYQIVCNILNISSTEYNLKVLKIESGSLFEMLIGSKTVIAILTLILTKITTLVFNKYTLDGEILRSKHILDIIKADTEILGKYKELGFDIDFAQEDIEKMHLKLIKSIHPIISKNTKLKINDKVISLISDITQKYLSETSKLLSEENSSEDIE